MRTIHKFPVWVDDFFTHLIPMSAKFLSVMLQGDRPQMWFEVDTKDDNHISRNFHVVGTGNPVPEGAVHLGSWVHDPFVWHLYETPIKKESANDQN